MKINKIVFAFFILISIGFYSCEDMLEITNESEKIVLEEDALKSKSDLQELLNSAYECLNGVYGGRFQRTSDLLSDDIALKPSITDEIVNIYNRYTTGYFTDNETYDEAYKSIMRANTVIEKLNSIPDLTDADKVRFESEAKFIRAISHFALIRLFAQPYGYTSDNSHLGVIIKTNTKIEILARNTVKEVYEQILNDLTSIEGKLTTELTQSYYATDWAVKALLAEVYFQMHNYKDAYIKANDVIINATLTFDSSIHQRFLAQKETILNVEYNPTTEAIFQLISTPGGKKIGDHFGTYRSDGTNNPNMRIDYKNKDIKDYSDANQDDKRIKEWYSLKNAGADNEYLALTKFNLDYKNVPILYLTQLKLLRAESAVLKETKELAVAITDINDIRARAFGNNTKDLAGNSTEADIISAVRKEKRIELVGEGYRVHDLKRRGSGGETSLMIRGVAWDYVGLAIQFGNSEINEKFVANPEPK